MSSPDPFFRTVGAAYHTREGALTETITARLGGFSDETTLLKRLTAYPSVRRSLAATSRLIP